MKQKKLIAAVGAAVVLGFGGATAQAADNFTGPYVGGSLMLFNNTTNETNADIDDLESTDGFVKLGADDSFSQLDLVLGYGMLLDNRVYLGAEARYTLVDNFKDSFIVGRVDDDNSVDFGIEGDGGYALMLQAGYAVSNNVVLYGTVGYVKREWDLVDKFVEDGRGRTEKEGLKSSGVGYGMGVKYALNRNFIVNAEVLKTNFSSKTLDDGFSIEPDSVSASVGVAYRF